MKVSIISIFIALLLFGCKEEKVEYLMSQHDYEQMILENDVAYRASRTASANLQDSLYGVYFSIIAEKYKLTSEQLKQEIRNRLIFEDHPEAVFDSLIQVVDSMTNTNEDDKKKSDSK